MLTALVAGASGASVAPELTLAAAAGGGIGYAAHIAGAACTLDREHNSIYEIDGNTLIKEDRG